MDPYEIVYNPWVTEKAQRNMEEENKLEFIVNRRAGKQDIRKAIEMLYEVKVEKVNTRISKEGKHATVKFAKPYKADEIATRIGVF
ncbi:MAG: 50S ribosomal protein L23 [Thermoplasmata archaeon]|nr:50S ribosomal protein L23 [Thermoplasmata archaeon]